MKTSAAWEPKELIPGERLLWSNDWNDQGTVIRHTDRSSVIVKWDTQDTLTEVSYFDRAAWQLTSKAEI